MDRFGPRSFLTRRADLLEAGALWALSCLIAASACRSPSRSPGGEEVRPLAPGQVESVHAFSEGESPEGIALDERGRLYVSVRGRSVDGFRPSSLWRIRPGGGAPEVLATLDEDVPETRPGILGITIGEDDAIYVALTSDDPTTHGVWRWDERGEVSRLPGSEAVAFPNALAFDTRGNLYATDTDAGAIWRFANGTGAAERWFRHEALADPGNDLVPARVGANGIAFSPPASLYVANTEGGLLARVAIDPDGSAGELRIVARDSLLLTVDGIAVDPGGDIVAVVPGAAALGTSPLVRIDAGTGEIVPLTDRIDAFDTPTSLALAPDGWSVYVVNAALRGGPPIARASGPGIVRVGLDGPEP